jgi:hypothetical protein
MKNLAAWRWSAMRETHEHQENAVLLVRRVRDLLNREIEAMTGKA